MYDNHYCLNDIVIQCDISTNPKEYIGSISSQAYVSKDKLVNLLSKAKATKSRELLKYLRNNVSQLG